MPPNENSVVVRLVTVISSWLIRLYSTTRGAASRRATANFRRKWPAEERTVRLQIQEVMPK
jgi:hypothetical protein